MIQEQKYSFPFMTILKRRGVYYMDQSTFDECLEGKYVYRRDLDKLVELKVKFEPKMAELFNRLINRSYVQVTHKNGYAIFKTK